jgi:aryl-alcohol dehydrogenase-like predicted oxidoreductase
MAAPPTGSRVEAAEREGWSESWSAYNTEHTWSILDVVFEVAEATGKSPAQVALNWVVHRPGVTAPITGVRTMAHLEDNLGATGWTLSDEQMARLTEVSEMAPGYPYNFIRGAAEARA